MPDPFLRSSKIKQKITQTISPLLNIKMKKNSKVIFQRTICSI